MSDNSFLNHSSRPFLIVANSSWYLYHYRELLLRTLQRIGHHVIALSPVDSSASRLSRLLVHIPWRIHRSQDANPLSLFISFLRLLFLVRAIKPRLVHSHTLKANLLSVLVTSFFGIPCVLSFAGLGRLSKSRGLARFAFIFILRFIAFFAFRARTSRWNWLPYPRRTSLIFQNPIDRQLFLSFLPTFPVESTVLIFGSGVPDRYSLSATGSFAWSSQSVAQPDFHFVFCARLLASKGIKTFLQLSQRFPHYRSTVYGSCDPSCNDSLTPRDVALLSSDMPNVNFAGNILDPLLHLNVSFPVLLVPSSYGEGLPRAILEALILGIPVICSQSATCGIFSDSFLYISKGDCIDDYEECIQLLHNDFQAGILSLKISKARDLVLSKFTEAAIVDQTLSLYNDLENDAMSSYLLAKDNSLVDHWLAQ